MIKIRALNESDSSSSDESSIESSPEDEAEGKAETITPEEKLKQLYSEGLRLIGKDEAEEAKDVLYEADDLLEKCKKNNQINEPSYKTFKYSIMKNLGNVCTDTLDHFMEALDIDSTDVSLWIRAGKRAFEFQNYLLAKYFFTEALKLNPLNWIAIDKLMDSLYLIADYYSCGKVAMNALRADPDHIKAQVLLKECCEWNLNLLSDVKSNEEFEDILEIEDDENTRTILDELGALEEKIHKEAKEKAEAKNVKSTITLSAYDCDLSSLANKIIKIWDKFKRGGGFYYTSPIEVVYGPDLQQSAASSCAEASCATPSGSATQSADESQGSDSQNGDRDEEKSQSKKSKAKRKRSFPTDFVDKRRSTRNRGSQGGGFVDEQAISDSLFNLLPENLKNLNDDDKDPEEEIRQPQAKSDREMEMEAYCNIIHKIQALQRENLAKCIALNDLVEIYMHELLKNRDLKIPSNFRSLYQIHRKHNDLPCPQTTIIGKDITEVEIFLCLTANELHYDTTEVAYLEHLSEYFKSYAEENIFKEFLIRLCVLKGEKERLVSYLEYVHDCFFLKDNSLVITGPNRLVISYSSIKSMIEQGSKPHIDAPNKDTRKVLEGLIEKPELELSHNDIEVLCKAIIECEEWQRGLAALERHNELTLVKMKTIKGCLQSGRAKLSSHLAHKLIRGCAESKNCMPWVCMFHGLLNNPIEDDKMVEFLKIGHTVLGKKGMCTGENGEFLLCVLDYMHTKSQSEEKPDILEECFMCLYGHPVRKRPLHNSPQIQLKWENCQPLYEYFIPEELPEYDSNRREAGIEAETEKLLIRIQDLVPKELKPDSKTQPILEYIEDGKELPPDFSSSSQTSDPITQSLYYFLADYYFKNKEFENAKKYYILDLSLNPDRFDSWAALALERSSHIENILSAGGQETMSSSEFYSAASKALRCYKKALQLDPKCTTLWIEYGNLAYHIGSHASRLRKISLFSCFSQVPDSAIMAENEILQAKQTEMLRISKYCFESANKTECEDEIWLRYFMLGKIAEKSNPLQAIKHYQLADLYLYLDSAEYPKKIAYHSPPSLAIEALEIHYRIHAVVLKHLTNEQNVGLRFLRKVKRYLLQALHSPFVNHQVYNPPEEMEEDESGDRPRNYDQETDDQREASVCLLMNDMVDLVADREKNSPEAIETLKQDIITMCLVAMKRCVARFPGHYKALFRLAHYFHTITRNEIAKALLLNPAVRNPSQQNRSQEEQFMSESIFSIDSLAGIFADRKSTNFFNGIWRIPVDEIDRPGSFNSHMFRCTFLLIRVAVFTVDYNLLSNIALQLSKKPDAGKKYLRDKERLILAKLSFESCITLIKTQLISLYTIPSLREQLRREANKIADRFIKSNVFVHESQAFMNDLRNLMFHR